MGEIRMLKILAILGMGLLISCVSIPEKKTLVMDYEDFGPPVIAHEVIGMDWWQWMSHGDSRPTQYPIKVVIYKGIPLTQVSSKYPVNAQQKKDYRYLEYANAIRYLNQMIADNVIDTVTEKLTHTRDMIKSSFN